MEAMKLGMKKTEELTELDKRDKRILITKLIKGIYSL